jgi:hypothetical protein
MKDKPSTGSSSISIMARPSLASMPPVPLTEPLKKKCSVSSAFFYMSLGILINPLIPNDL